MLTIEKIILLIGTLSFGGSERVTITLSEWLSDRNFNVRIVTIDERDNEYKLDQSVKRYTLSNYHGKTKKIYQLRKMLKKEKPDIVLVMGVPLLVYLYPAIIGLGIPLIVSERNDPANYAGKKITKYISHLFLNFSNGVVFQTKKARDYYPIRIRKKSCIIPNPLLNKNIPKVYNGKRTKKIVSIGRLVKQKNQLLLIRAFKEVQKKFPDYKLVIYGEGPERDELENEIKILDLENNVFLPGISSNVLEEIKDAKMFVLSSNFEGIPNSLIEAMAIGLPCISTDTPSGGPALLIRNMENGVLVPVKDKKALISSMIELIRNDQLSENIARNAAKIKFNLDPNLICSKWLKFINEIYTNYKKND